MTDGTDRIETGVSLKGFTPHTEYFGFQREQGNPFSPDFRQKFKKISEGVYPQEPIKRMIGEGYNPVVIGYSHSSPAELDTISKKLAELKEQKSR